MFSYELTDLLIKISFAINGNDESFAVEVAESRSHRVTFDSLNQMLNYFI